MTNVAVVLNEIDAAALRDLLGRAHVWLADSPTNTVSARTVWERRDEYPFAGELTTFQPKGSSAEEWLRAVLADVDQHHDSYSEHGEWTVLEIRGVHMTPGLREFLHDLGVVECESFGDQLLARRLPA